MRNDAIEEVENNVSSSNEKYNVWSTGFTYRNSDIQTIQLPAIPEMLAIIEYGNIVAYSAMAQLPGIMEVNCGKFVMFRLDESILTLLPATEFSTTVNVAIYVWYK